MDTQDWVHEVANSTVRITVRRDTNWKGQPGYRWTCSAHLRHGGFHHFDRWTDRIRRTPDLHPWQRCMRAAVWHHYRFHRAERAEGGAAA